jgi:large-conductance mechanosensitive channel
MDDDDNGSYLSILGIIILLGWLIFDYKSFFGALVLAFINDLISKKRTRNFVKGKTDFKDIIIYLFLFSVGIFIIIGWLISNYKSFFGALITSIIVISIFMYSKKKDEIKRKEKEKRRKIEEKEKIDRLIKEQRDRLKKEQKENQFNKEQNAKGLYKYEGKWGTKEQIKRWEETKYGISQNFKNMTPFEFEEFIAKLFRKMGYDAHTTTKTGDYGIDVIAKKDGKKIGIQCKQNKIGNNVGNVVVQSTLGSMWKIKADKSIIITTSDFTTQAEEQAKEAPIELWDRHYLKEIVEKYFMT